MSRPPSQADHDLSARLAAVGVSLQPERVQRFREVGLLPKPAPDFPGGGGSGGRYPDIALEQAREASELAGSHPHALFIAVAEMYARGNYRVEERKLKRALLHIVDRFDADIHEAADQRPGDGGAHDDVALKAGARLAKRMARDPAMNEMRRRIKRGGERREAVVASAMANISMVFLAGRPLSEEGMLEAATLLGFGEFAPELLKNPPPGVQLDQLFETGSALTVRRAIQRADIDELEVARDDYKDMVRWSTYASEVIPIMSGLPLHEAISQMAPSGDFEIALGALNVLRFRYDSAEEMEREIASLRQSTPTLRAFYHLLEGLPKRLHQVIGPNNEKFAETLSKDDWKIIDDNRARFRAEYPLDARLLDKLKAEA